MNLEMNRIHYSQKEKLFYSFFKKLLLSFSLLFFLPYQGNSQVVDTILMTVETFEGDDSVVTEFTRKQIAKILSSELTDYVIPVLNIEEKSRVIHLRARYKASATDTSAPSSKYPNYICQGIISKDFITANITRSQNEAILLSVQIDRKKGDDKIQKDVKNLARELIEEFIEEVYQVSLGKDSRIILRLDPKANLEVINSGNPMRAGEREIEVGERAIIVNLRANAPGTNPIEENLQLRSKALQFVSVKKHKKTIKIRQLKNKVEMRAMISLNNNYLNTLYEFSVKRELGKNFSIGLGVSAGQLSYDHSLSTFNDLAPIVTKENKQFYSPDLLLDYEHFFSSSEIIISSELGISPMLKGGHFQTSLGWANLPWLGLEIGVRNYAVDIDRFQFQTFQNKAEKYTQQERFSFLTLGVRLKHNF